MKAVTFNFETQKFVYRSDVAVPEPCAGEALVRVHAAAVNSIDTMHRHWSKMIDKNTRDSFVPGVDVAGVVEKIVPDANGKTNGFKEGDRVIVHPWLPRGHGGLAEYSIATNDFLVKLPDSIPLSEAAAIPCCGFTAYKALFSKLHVQAGNSIVISGAAGSLGGFGIQLARAAGCSPIIALCSPSSEAHVLALGATHTVDYHVKNILEAIQAIEGCKNGVDCILDCVSGENAKKLSAALAFDGQVVSCNGIIPCDDSESYFKGISYHTVATAPAMYLGGRQQVKNFENMSRALVNLIARGAVRTMTSRHIKKTLTTVTNSLNNGLSAEKGRKIIVQIAGAHETQ